MWKIRDAIKRLWVKGQCRVFGHIPTHLKTDKMQAICGRCGAKLNVSYDMSNGETIVLKEIK
jgi:hypothetical protein